MAHHLRTETKRSVQGRAKLGIEAFAEAVLGFPKILAENSGHDPQECIIRLQVRRVWWGTRVRVGLWAKVGGVGIIPWMQHATRGLYRLTTACWSRPLRVWHTGGAGEGCAGGPGCRDRRAPGPLAVRHLRQLHCQEADLAVVPCRHLAAAACG